MTVNKYRLWCVTEQAYKYVWSEEPPTTCPTNTQHEINVESITIVDKTDTDIHVMEPANNFAMQTNGTSKTMTKNATTTMDFKIENYGSEAYEVKYLRGADWLVRNSVDGDYASFSVIDIDNVLGYGANTVLKTYVLKKFIFKDEVTHCDALAPGAIPVGTYLRCTYTSVGTEVDPKMYINYHVEVKG